jgi:pimeloyl-ACP methyl ester carboxylesterase
MIRESEKGLMGFSKMRIVLLVLLFVSFCLGSIFYFAKEIIQKFAPWRIERFVGFLDKGSLLDIRMSRCLPDKDINLKRDDGLKVAGSLYGVRGDIREYPGILLLHGNTPLGRKLPIYKVLATKLVEREYIVLTIDFAGFGGSGDPFALGTKKALNSDRAVYTALNYLRALENVNKNKIYIIGHSMGANAAFSVGIKEASIKKIVVIGPARRTTERLLNPHDRNYFWNRWQDNRKIVYRKQFPLWYTKDYWLKTTLDSDMKKYIPYFSQPSHKPLFLIDGEREHKKDKIYLQNFYENITEPKKYLTVPNSDHYFNIEGFCGLNFYDKIVVDRAVDEIDRWFKM